MTLRDSLNASTEHVLNTSLPSLLHHDGYRSPDRLLYHIPIEHISTETRKRARAIVEKAEHNITRLWMEENGRGRHVYYVLSQSQTKFTKITEALKERCPVDCLKHGTPESMKCVMAAKTAVDLAACPK